MNYKNWFLLSLICIAGIGCSKNNNSQSISAKNPFGVKDVGEINYEEAQRFASVSVLNGADNDPNAEKWAEPQGLNGETGTIEGNWSSRWSGGSMGSEWSKGKAQIKKVDETFFILYEDNGKYLIEGKKEQELLIGKYINLNNENDVGPWVGKIVSKDRIDGRWPQGRWDFRR